MKTRSEKYKDDYTIKRTEKNQYLYDDLYLEKNVSNSVTLMDNVNEIDIRKIKDIINSREEYQKINQYKDLINIKEKQKEKENIEEIDYKKYDINELIESKKQNQNIDEDIIRKISNTQYDILEKLNINKTEEFYKQDEKLKTLINEMKKDDINNQKSMLDLFSDIPEQEINKTEYRTKDDDFYSSKLEFKNKDFEEITKKDKDGLITKILIIVMILLMIAIGVIVFINFM